MTPRSGSRTKVVSQNEVSLREAKLEKAQAKADLAKAELGFATVKAPFDGMVDRLHSQQGSLVQAGETLTTLSDNSLMWVYFNVPEARYLEYQSANLDEHKDDAENRTHVGQWREVRSAWQARCDRGGLQSRDRKRSFRADFPNPDGLLHHGQTGTVLISRGRT